MANDGSKDRNDFTCYAWLTLYSGFRQR